MSIVKVYLGLYFMLCAFFISFLILKLGFKSKSTLSVIFSDAMW